MPTETYNVDELLGPLNGVERKNAPEKLFVSGDTQLLRRGPRVSVVGSRKPSEDGISRARVLTRGLIEREIVVVSGLAEGIDTVAHRTAIEEGGSTVAVLGTPLSQFFPVKNRSLQEEMMRTQLVVSQFPEGYASQRKNFPMRNRTMALLSDATVIVEASGKSGTRHQGWEALRLGRLVFLLENVAKDKTLSWPAEMIKYGAQVLSRENLSLMLNEMPDSCRSEALTL